MRSLFAILLIAIASLNAACSKQSSSEWFPDEPMVSEGVLACEAMVERFDKMNIETATELELEAAMKTASDSFDRCDRQFKSAGRTQAERAFYAHRSDQIRIHELLFEATLSRRFDEMTGYCVILRDIVRVLAGSIESMDNFFASNKLSAEDERQLGELYQLDVQSLELLSVQLTVTCDGLPPPRATPRTSPAQRTRGR